MGKTAHHAGQAAPPRPRHRVPRLAAGLGLLLLLAGGVTALVGFGAAGPAGAADAATPGPPETPGPGQLLLFGAGPPAATPVFTIPLGPQGIGIWSDTDGLYGLAVTADGSFWVGDWAKGSTQDGGRLLHYSASGTLLGIVPAPGDHQRGGFVNGLQAWGPDLWAIVQRSLLRLAPDGTVRANYPLPDRLDGQAVAPGSFKPDDQAGLSFLLGPRGEILLLPDVPATRVARLVDAAGRLATLHPGADGTTDLATTPAFPGQGRDFTAQIATPHTGRIMAGTVPITLTTAQPLAGLHLFHVNPDDSFYVLAEETFANPAGVYATILHYQADGTLRAHARLPLAGRFAAISRRLTVAPDGAVYALVGGHYGTDTDRDIHVERVNFYPPGDPLPAPLSPTPTPAPPTPTATPTLTFADLVAQSPLIVELVMNPAAGTPVPLDQPVPGEEKTETALRENVTVSRWLRKPPGPHGDGLGLLLRTDQDQRLRTGAGRFILFLRPVQALRWGWGDALARLYEITSDAGLIEVRADRLVSPALPAFDGLPEAALTDALARQVAPPAPDPPDTIVDIAALTHQADMILEGDIADVYGGTGAGTGYGVRVRRWLKKPAGVLGDDTYFWTEKGDDGNTDEARLDLGSGHFILFLEGPASDLYRREPHVLALFSIRDGRIDYADVPRYWGWPLEDFVGTIRTALADPAPPAPPMGTGQESTSSPPVQIALPTAPRWVKGTCPQEQGGRSAWAATDCWQGSGGGLTVSVRLRQADTGEAANIAFFQGTDYDAAAGHGDGRISHALGFTAPDLGPLDIAAIAGTRVTLVPREEIGR